MTSFLATFLWLYNQDFLEDILPYINTSFQNRIKYHRHLCDIYIEDYGDESEDKDYLGYYSSNNPNGLFVKNYDGIENYKDTLAHEFIHLCQNSGNYNTITEACAEIISFEYFPETRMSAYDTQVRLVKKLMEIIGPAPIWYYNFTGDFKPVEDEVKPFLDDKQYSIFLECLSFEHGNHEKNLAMFNSLEELIGVIYKNKYHVDIKDNEIMRAIGNSAITLKRYYFNKRKMNAENSYYIDRSIREYGRLSYEEAMERNVFYAYAVRYDPVTYEEAMEAKNNSISISREIDYRSNDITILHRTDRSFETEISAIVDGVRYDHVSLDSLASKGIIKINYYKTNFQTLTAQEYLNQECIEGATIYSVYSQKDLTLYDNYIEGYYPAKIYIEPINGENIISPNRLTIISNSRLKTTYSNPGWSLWSKIWCP